MVSQFSHKASLPRRLEEFMEESVVGLKTSLRKVLSPECDRLALIDRGLTHPGFDPKLAHSRRGIV